MSQEYMVLIVDADEDQISIQGCQAEVFMRFTEHPSEKFLGRLALENPGKRVYCLMGSSTWWSHP